MTSFGPLIPILCKSQPPMILCGISSGNTISKWSIHFITTHWPEIIKNVYFRPHFSPWFPNSSSYNLQNLSQPFFGWHLRDLRSTHSPCSQVYRMHLRGYLLCVCDPKYYPNFEQCMYIPVLILRIGPSVCIVEKFYDFFSKYLAFWTFSSNVN